MIAMFFLLMSYRFTVPVLWDKKHSTIVNNESSEIIRIFNHAFNEFLPADKAAVDLYPESLRAEIDSLNEWVYPTINSTYLLHLTLFVLTSSSDGVYRSGFAKTQKAYEIAVNELFQSLDRVEKILQGKDYIVGNTLTECDVRLWVTLVLHFSIFIR